MATDENHTLRDIIVWNSFQHTSTEVAVCYWSRCIGKYYFRWCEKSTEEEGCQRIAAQGQYVLNYA